MTQIIRRARLLDRPAQEGLATMTVAFMLMVAMTIGATPSQAQGCDGKFGILIRGPVVVEMNHGDRIRGSVIDAETRYAEDGSSEPVLTMEMWDGARTVSIGCRSIRRFFRDTLEPERLGATIKGRVIGSDGKPLKTYVVVEGLDKDSMVAGEPRNVDLGRVETDEEGNYSFALPIGRYYSYYFEREGYYPLARVLDLRDSTLDPIVAQEGEVLLLSFEEMVAADRAVRINNVFFDFNSSRLQPASYPELDRVAAIVRRYGFTVFIEGHTDDIGSAAFNLALSLDRATEVCNYLIAKGCPAGKLVPVGIGEGEGIADNNTPEGRAQNRRVDFRVTRSAEE